MNENFKENIKIICRSINTYIKSNSNNEIDILENKLELFADVDRVKLSQINKNNSASEVFEIILNDTQKFFKNFDDVVEAILLFVGANEIIRDSQKRGLI